MKKVYIFLVDGFEEIEAITPIDLLRRAGIEVCTVGVNAKTVTGAHGVSVQADIYEQGFSLPQDAVMVLLPGGAGVEALLASDMVADVLKTAKQRDIYIAAICAAPLVLHKAGLLQGKRVTAFPSVQANLSESDVTGAAVEVDGKLITARAAGVALQFSHALIEALEGKDKADEVVASVYP